MLGRCPFCIPKPTKMFPQLDRIVPCIEDKILSYLEPRDLAASMLVCKDWCQKARPLLYKLYANSARKEGVVPLIKATRNGHHHQIVFLLRDEQTDVNEKGWYGQTALMEAAIRGNVEIARMLLDTEDIEVNIRNNNGYNALSYANGTIRFFAEQNGFLNKKKIIQMLMERNVDTRT